MIEDMAADLAFTISRAGRERREDREIAYAEEIMRLRQEMRLLRADRDSHQREAIRAIEEAARLRKTGDALCLAVQVRAGEAVLKERTSAWVAAASYAHPSAVGG
tara:strand:+ start:14759 stop:15073 length:315 start_codon:yes stop_codon:yes gene_type:complete